MPATRIRSGRLGRTPGSIRQGLLGTGKFDLEQYEESVGEYMEDFTDDFLHELYGHVAPMLANRFEDFMRHSDSEVAAIVQLARSIGIRFLRAELAGLRRDRGPNHLATCRSLGHPCPFNWLVEHARERRRRCQR